MILPLFFLFNGYLRPRPDGQRLEPYPEGLEILRNRMVFTKRDRSEKEYTPWFTTVRGIFHITDEDFDDLSALYMLDTKIIFQMLPENALPLLWAAKGEKWLETINEFFRQNQVNGVELRVTKVYKKHLRQPDPNEPGLDSEDFKKWFAAWPEEAPFYGFIIPKTRSIVVSFTSHEYNGAKVALITPTGRTIKAEEVTPFMGLPEVFGVSFSGDKEFLPEGLYKISVTDIPTPVMLGEKFRITRSYVFHEHVTFSTRNLVCDLEVILADGISLEGVCLKCDVI